jgi:hypothetical protein
VPLYPENAWPGCDYLKTFTKMGPQIIDLAASSDSVSRLSECVVAKWEPPTESALLAEMKERKWQSATVLFYNWVTGTGFALTEDGKRCFLHFSNILNSRGEPIAENGAFPLVESMKEIAVRVGPGNKPGTFAAKDIRRLK